MKDGNNAKMEIHRRGAEGTEPSCNNKNSAYFASLW